MEQKEIIGKLTTEKNYIVRVAYVDGNTTDLYCVSKSDAIKVMENIARSMAEGLTIKAHENLYINPRNVIYIEKIDGGSNND